MKYYVYEQDYPVIMVDEYEDDSYAAEESNFQLSPDLRTRLVQAFEVFHKINLEAHRERDLWIETENFKKRPEYEI